MLNATSIKHLQGYPPYLMGTIGFKEKVDRLVESYPPYLMGTIGLPLGVVLVYHKTSIPKPAPRQRNTAVNKGSTDPKSKRENGTFRA